VNGVADRCGTSSARHPAPPHVERVATSEPMQRPALCITGRQSARGGRAGRR
jgi:hypothetical protein